jgi:hypothetical protein
MTSKADKLLQRALQQLKIENKSSEEKFNNIYKLMPVLDSFNKEEVFSVSTTGTISERICGWALDAALPDGYFRNTSNEDKWLGDYIMLGAPFNVVISVKSYKAKERLLVSGSGSLLVPTIGWGLFDDPTEFKLERLKNYLYRGFIAIYMPKSTLKLLDSDSKKLENTHKEIFIRPIENLISDIRKSKIKKKFGKTSIEVVNPKIF